MALNLSGTTGIVTGNIAASNITTATIADANVTTAKILNANVTYNKLSNSATEADNVAKRTAKAWVRFNGATPTIASSFNVSSVSRGAAGIYTINLTSAMSDADYSAVITTSDLSGVSSSCAMLNAVGVAPTTTAFNANTVRRDTGAGFDPVYVSVMVFGA